MTLKEAYSYSVQFLTRNGVEEADFKALCLCCHLTGITNSQYAAHQADELMPGPLAKMLWRVKEGEPLQYVLGSWDFYESEFQVGRGVLIPRPETEELVALALKTAEAYAAPVVVDLCAGSGCIGVSIAKKRRDSRVFCVEKSADAFVYLEKNAASCENVTAVLGDLRDELPVLPADLLVSNPPYILSSASYGRLPLAVLQMVMCMFPCYFLSSSQPPLLPLCP